ncbi:MAG TPA: nucleotide sugar dehydrogenase [Anaerolineae bacterium]|nr:nucleotide sugar dehydrogenase [Anaerolineae bacterium]HQH37930.1 nucleotide sugar dehydrogenase [Anaerolineae bacterium]
MNTSLSDKITYRTAKVAIIGMGYVGLPLALGFARAGFVTVGIEVNAERVHDLNAGHSYIEDVANEELLSHLREGRLSATTDYDVLRDCDAIFICVPTPYTIQRTPDLSYILAATESIAPRLKPQQLVVLQSTTYPGTTTEVVQPILERVSGMKASADDFYLAFSPERIDPGNKHWSAYNTPKVVGGLTANATAVAAALLRQMGAPVHEVSSPAAAELTKLLENTFRAVNIALVNEMAQLAERMGIDFWEVIDAAKTKPFGFMPFRPGPGVGGHCLSENEYIFVRHDTGLCAVRVGDYVRTLQQPPLLEQGGVTLWNPPHLEILSFDPYRRETCSRPVEFLSRRAYEGAMVNVQTADGRRLTVTDGHPMMVWNGVHAVTRRADQLQPGDELIVPLGMPASTTALPPLDLIDSLTVHDMARVRVTPMRGRFDAHQETLTPHLRKLGVAARDVYRSNAMPLSAYLELERQHAAPFSRADLWLGTGRGPSYSRCPAVLDWDEDLARLIGYYLSKGCITEGTSLCVRFTFNTEERETLADLQQILEKLGLHYSIYRDKQWNSQHIKVSSRPLARLLRDGLQCGVNAHTMHIPAALMTASEALRMALLSGLLRGAGDVHHVNQEQDYQHHINTCTVSYFTSSPDLFQQVVVLLQGLGFVPTCKRDKPQLRLYGAEPLQRLTPLFLDVKRRRLEAYQQGRSKSMTDSQSTRHTGFATVKVHSTQRQPMSPDESSAAVYSVEVTGTHTFVTSYGVLVHNCIPIDPYYLLWKAREYDFWTRFIELAAETNEAMPYHVVELVTRGLNLEEKSLHGARVLVLGVAFKPDIGDSRDTPAERIIELLLGRGADVRYHDPFVPVFHVGGNVFCHDARQLESVELTDEELQTADVIVVVTGHHSVDYGRILRQASLVVDSCNATQGIVGTARVVRLGAPLTP